LRNPTLTGDVSLLNGRFVKSPGPVNGLNGQIRFRGSSATIAFANLDLADARLPLHGAIEFADTSNVSITLVPDVPIYELTPVAPGQCISGANIFGARRIDSETNALAQVQEIELRGGLGSDRWTITFAEYGPAQPLNSKSLFSRSFSLCKSDGDVLQFALSATEKPELGQRALNIFRDRNLPASMLKPPPLQ
jgi:hypothetical protein